MRKFLKQNIKKCKIEFFRGVTLAIFEKFNICKNFKIKDSGKNSVYTNMENYDLLSLYKYTTKSTGASTDDTNVCDSSEEALTLSKIGGFELPDCTLVSSNDSALIDGKQVDAFGTLTDEDVEQALANQKVQCPEDNENSIETQDNGEEIVSESKIKTIFDFSIFKKWGKKFASDLKVFLYNLYHPENPYTPDPGYDGLTPTAPIPSSDGTDGTGPAEDVKKTIDQNLVFSRGDAAKTIKVSDTEQVVTLKNPFGATDYQYTVTSTNGASVNATFQFLKNGRFVITGDNIKIVSNSNQKDDIILMGNNCEVDTGDGDDIIRVGYVGDTKTLKMTNGQSRYYITSSGSTYVGTVNNKIYSGSGNDYISILGEGYTIDTGSEADYVHLIGEINHSAVDNAELVYDFHSKTSTIDGIDGWVLQGIEGDCRLLAFINSLCKNQNIGKLSDFVTIQKSGSGYAVVFNNYPETNNSISVSQSEIDSYKGIYGDLDTVILDMALNKLLAINKDRGQKKVEKAYYNTISKYIFGNEKMTYLSQSKDKNNFSSRFLELWDKYKLGEISNFQIGIHTENHSLGLISGHAYSVRNIVENEYVEIINPWDDADCLRLDWNDFMSLSLEAIVYGEDIFGENLLIPNGGTITTLADNDEETLEMALVSQPVSSVFDDSEVQLMNEIEDIQDKVKDIKNLIYDENKKNIELLS